MKFVDAFALSTLIGANALFSSAPAAAADQTMPTCTSGDPVVWENAKSKVYHLKGDTYFGNTKSGSYACKSAADGAGYHAAKSRSSTSATTTASPDAAASPDASDSAAPSTRKHHHHHKKSSASPSPAPSPTGT